MSLTEVEREVPEDSAQPQSKRVHVNFAMKTYAMLQRIARRKSGSLSEALRQSISLTDYIENATESGARILIERNGQITELLIR